MNFGIDAVLPLTARDAERARILVRSLERHLVDLGTLWVVVPAADQVEVSRALGSRARVVPELDVVPEFERVAPRPRGWFRQQLVKLAIAEHVATPSYLTLDADVICTRRVSSHDLSPSGKPICHVVSEAKHPDWYRQSEQTLGLRAPRRGITHNVTPVVLARDAVLELARHFERQRPRLGIRGARQALALLGARRSSRTSGARWRLMLAAGTPWTEYALYYTYLEATGRLDTYHTVSARPISDERGSIWRADRDRFAEWDPAPCFEGEGPPWFMVVQSNTGIPPSAVLAKVERYVA